MNQNLPLLLLSTPSYGNESAVDTPYGGNHVIAAKMQGGQVVGCVNPSNDPHITLLYPL